MEIICRICRNTCKKLIPLFKIVSNSNELEIEGEKFEYCIGLQILEIPNYPGICTVCEQQLNDFYTFKQQAIKSHYKLLEIILKNTFNNDNTEKTSESLSLDDLENIEDDEDFFILDTMDRFITESDEDFFNSLGPEEKEFENENEFKVTEKNKIDETYISFEILDTDDDCGNDLNRETENVGTTYMKEIDEASFPEKCNDNFGLTRVNDEDSFEEIALNEKPSVEHCDDELQKNQSQELTKTSREIRKDFNNVKNDNDFSETTSEKVHMKIPETSSKNSIEIYKCDVCGVKFNCEQKLEGHMNEHKGLPAYQCNICGKTYKFECRDYYNDHMNDHQGIERRYKCELCPKSYHKIRDLNVHMRLHKNERPFVCEACGKQFITKHSLNRHLETHADDVYRCGICYKSFRAKSTLKTHMKEIHLPKPFSCEICKKKFGRKQYYQMHIDKNHRNLEDEKCQKNRAPFVCKTCGDEFITRENLTHHLQTFHYLECDMCSKRFCADYTLKIHKLEIHQPKRFNCDLCKIKFGRKQSYMIHFKKHHRNLENEEYFKDFKDNFYNARRLKKKISHDDEGP